MYDRNTLLEAEFLCPGLDCHFSTKRSQKKKKKMELVTAVLVGQEFLLELYS